MRTAAIYARYSTDLQNERSIADQVAMARAYAAKNDLSVVETYSDAAASGGSMFGRDGLFNLMADARSGLFKVLIVESLDRLSRDMADSAEIHKRLTFAGVEIATLNDGVATTLTVGLRSMMGQLYREDLAHKTRRGMAGMVRQGKSAGGRSYGYDIDPRAKGELIINQAEAAIVLRIFEDYAAGKSPVAISADLNREGVPAPRARHWQHTAILGSAKELTGILRNPLYDGRRVWNKRAFHKDPDSGGRVSRMNPREDWQFSDAEHLRIIDRGLFVRVQQLLGDGSKTHAQAGASRRNKRLLAGLLKCAGCGGVLTVVGKDKSGRNRMGCSAHMSGKPCPAPKTFYYEKVEALVIDTMRAGLEDHEAMAEYVRVYNETRLELARQAGAKRRQIEKRIADLDGEITRALNLLMKGIGSEDRMGAEIRTKEAQLADLKAELAREPATPDVVGLHPQTIATYHRQLRDLQAELTGQGEAKRSPRMAELMRDLVHSITVLPDHSKVGGFKIVIDGNLRVFLNDGPSWGTVGAGARFELTTFRL